MSLVIGHTGLGDHKNRGPDFPEATQIQTALSDSCHFGLGPFVPENTNPGGPP